MKKELLAISAFTVAAGAIYYVDSAQTVPSLGQLQARATEGSTPEPSKSEPESRGSEGEDAGATPSDGDEYVGDPDDSDSEDEDEEDTEE